MSFRACREILWDLSIRFTSVEMTNSRGLFEQGCRPIRYITIIDEKDFGIKSLWQLR